MGSSTADIATPCDCPSDTRAFIVCSGEQLLDQHADLRPGREPRSDHVVLGVLEVFGLPQPAPQPVPLSRRHHAQPDVAVLARVDRVGVLVLRASAPPVGSADARGGLAVRPECRIERHHDSLEPGKVNVIACATTQSVVVGDQRGPGGLNGGGGRRDTVRRRDGCPGGGARPCQRPRQRIQHRIGCPPRRTRPRSAEIGHRHRHQLRKAIRQVFARGSVCRGLAGIPAVDDDVGAAGEFDQPRRSPAGRTGRAPCCACSRCAVRSALRCRRSVGRRVRDGLPPGGSTFRTSAPKSANSRVTASPSSSDRSSTRSDASRSSAEVVTSASVVRGFATFEYRFGRHVVTGSPRPPG